MDNEETYVRYREVIRNGTTIIADDRIKLTALKTDRNGRHFPLCREWWKSPILEPSEKEQRRYWSNGKEHVANVYHWRYSMLPESLRGTSITIAGNHVIIELHNIMNGNTERSRLKILVMVLRELHQWGILRPGSRSSFYRIAGKFTISEYEIRYDYRHGLIPHKFIRMFSFGYLKTHYYRDKDTSTPMLTYQYPGFTRFEMILRGVDSIRGTARQIIGRLSARIRNVWRHWLGLASLLEPIFRVTVFLESLKLSGENLLMLSQKLNGTYLKFL